MAAEAERAVTDQEAREWRPAIKGAWKYARSRQGDVSIALVDLKGRVYKRNAFERRPMASVYKVMLLVAYLRQRSVRHRSLASWEEDLLRPMIRRSDDAAATKVDEMLGRGPLERLAKRAKMRSFVWRDYWGLSETSARDQAFFMRKLERYVPGRHWGFARTQLSRIVASQRWGVGQAKPRGWHLRFKGGWGSGSGAVEHQVALLTRSGRRLGAGVMIERSPSHAYAKQTLEGIFRRLLWRLPR